MLAGYLLGGGREGEEGGDKTLMAAPEEAGMIWRGGGRTLLALLAHGMSLVSGSRQDRWVADKLVGVPSSAL